MALSPARVAVIRSTVLFTPFLAITVAVLVLLLRDFAGEGASAGRIVGTVIVSIVVVLLGYQVVQSVRDLLAQPVETTGAVERRWSHSDFFLFRNSYMLVERNVFRLSDEQFIRIDIGDTVRVRHFPHTCAVEHVEVVAQAEQAAGRNDA